MTEHEALAKMVAPGDRRPGKWGDGGVMQIHLTRACDKACFGCLQGSNLAGKPTFMTPEQFEAAVKSLDGYFGVFGVFGGNAPLSPHFEACCEILRRHVPFERRGLWSNHPRGKAKVMRETFNPRVSNLNVHLDADAFAEFKRDWPESLPFGLHPSQDSRHSPPWVAMKDLDVLPANPGQDAQYLTKMPNTEENRWKLIAGCDVGQNWSAMIGVFRGQLRAWWCEFAGAQSILHQDESDYPDTGIDPTKDYDHLGNVIAPLGITDETGRHLTCDELGVPRPLKWWQLPMLSFAHQVRKHCHDCGVPLRGYGELACSTDPAAKEQVSEAHVAIFRPKRPGRRVETVTTLTQLGVGRIERVTDYVGNSRR